MESGGIVRDGGQKRVAWASCVLQDGTGRGWEKERAWGLKEGGTERENEGGMAKKRGEKVGQRVMWRGSGDGGEEWRHLLWEETVRRQVVGETEWERWGK